MTAYKYIIINNEDNSIVRWHKEEQEARESLYKIRKHKYIDEHPDLPKDTYDKMMHDNGYNLYKINLVRA